MKGRFPNSVPACATCGIQYEPGAELPEVCRLCADSRQYIGWDGQRWTSTAELAGSGTVNRIEPELGGVVGVGAEPSVAIGQRGLLVPGEEGNVLWDCPGFLDGSGVARIAEAGGISAIALSHPHFYGCMADYSEAFDDAPIYVHAADTEWVTRSGNVVFWEGERTEILPGRTLVNAGVHFDGGTVLHWADGPTGQGALFSGDIFTVVMDRRWLSFMYSYPNLIPERPEVVRTAIDRVGDLEFEQIYGAWWGRVVQTGGTGALRRSAERYLDAVSDP